MYVHMLYVHGFMLLIVEAVLARKCGTMSSISRFVLAQMRMFSVLCLHGLDMLSESNDIRYPYTLGRTGYPFVLYMGSTCM